MLTQINGPACEADESSLLRQIAGLTAQMLGAGEARDWAAVGALDAARFELLKSLPSDCFNKDNELASAVLRDALEVTQKVALMAAQARDHERKGQLKIKHGRRATTHYLSNAQTA